MRRDDSPDPFERGGVTPAHGGARKGAGRKPKHNEPTRQTAFALPVSLLDALRAAAAVEDVAMVDVVERALRAELESFTAARLRD